MANMQRVDDFDMVKLQKSLRQQQRRSHRMQGVVTKLSPAEVRSLNISAATSKVPSKPVPAPSKKPGFSTPPLTPENATTNRQTPGGNLPTPPHSPDDAALRRQSAHSSSDVPIHSPVPVSHAKPNFVTTTHHSRPSSVSSHRSMPTYRGNEITRSGSISMLLPSVPTHHIVDNPLSQFSRPRLSVGGGSVSPTRHEPRQPTHSGSADWASRRDRLGLRPDASITPPPSVRSSTSAKEHEADTAPHRESIEPGITRAETVAVDGSMPSKPSSRFSWHWKRNGASPHVDGTELAEAKKHRRRTIAWSKSPGHDTPAIAYEDTKPGNAPEIKQTLKGDLPSNKAQFLSERVENVSKQADDFATHPAVRPLDSTSPGALQNTSPDKGKQKEEEEEEEEAVPHDVLADESVPMYSRCSCCGKLKNPINSRALSPVLENENLRTNFSLEIENVHNVQAGRRRSSSADRQKYTAILPMVMAEGNIVQAKIAPQKEKTPIMTDPTPPPVNERGDIIARGSEPVPLAPKKVEEKEKKVVRFSSLHLKEAMERQAEDCSPPTEFVKHEPDSVSLSSARDDPNEICRQDLVDEPMEPSTTTPEAPELALRSGTRGTDTAASSIPTDMTGALMVAMSGVDTAFDDILKDIEEQMDRPVFGDFVSDDGAWPIQSNPTTAAEVHQLVTTRDTPPVLNASAVPPEGFLHSDPVRDPVVDEPAAVPVQQLSVPVTKPKSILKPTPRSSYNNSPRTSVDYTYSMPTSYDSSSPGVSRKGSFSTKPKATAKYMLTSSSETRTSPMMTRTTTATSMQGTTITTTTMTTTAGPLTQRAEANPMAAAHYAKLRPTAGPRNASSDSLPDRQRRPQSSRSNSSLSDRPTSSRRSRSSLMDSVLAATKQDKRSKFERALGRI